MRRVLILTGVLGGGSALTFAAAALAATLFPNGTVVSAGGWNGPWPAERVAVDGGPVVFPMPVPVGPDTTIGPALPAGVVTLDTP